MHRFLLTVGARPPAAVERYLARADVDELSYAPTGHARWSGRDGRVQAAGWWTGVPDHEFPADGSATMWGGNIRIAGSPGRPSAADLGRAIDTDMSNPHRLLRDAYSIARLDGAGNGIAFADELSNHPLFFAEPAPDVMVVGNRPSLVAAVDARWRGERPRRSTESAAWMAFAGYVVGDGTGFEGVRQVPQGAVLRVTDGRASIATAAPIYAGDPDDRLDVGRFADSLEAEIADALHHALAISERPQLELTGGKDSRLVFAVAHRAGILDRFSVTTYGAADLLDVRIAAELCELLDIPHNHIRTRKPADAPTYSSMDRIRRHVHRTCGVSQVGDAVEPTPCGPTYVSGLYGEYFRTGHPGEARNPATSVDQAAERFPVQRRFGAAGILRPDVIDRLGTVALEYALAPATEVRDPADLRAAFTVRFRFPAWQNPLVDRNMNAILPLASGALVRDAFRLTPHERGLELPHRIIMERADPRIARHPFANSAWRKPKPQPKAKPQATPPPPRPAPLPSGVDRIRRLIPPGIRRALHPIWRVVQRRRTPATSEPPEATPTPAPKPAPPTTDIEPTPGIEGVSSVRKRRDWLPVNRTALAELLANDRGNPLFEFVDYDALLAHATGEGPGDPLANLQVNGAITAFLWLGAHELPSRTDG